MRLPLLAAAAFATVPCLANPTAPVTSVVLYPGSATIVRTAQVAAGATEVHIGKLPSNFNVSTLRVQAAPGLRIGEVITRDEAGTEPMNAAESELESRIQALNDQHAMLQAEIKSAEIVKGYLERYNGSADKAAGASDAKALGGVIDTLGKGASDALSKIQKLTVQQRELSKKIAALKSDLTGLQSGAKDSRSITVRLAGGKAGTVTLSYQLNNAGWKPHYRAGLNSAASTVDLERLATIAQKTGEDWSNISLTLSTSRPSLSAAASEPQPWLLTYYPPQPAAERANFAMAAPPAPAPVMVTGSRIKPEIGYDAIAESQSAFATEFEVPGRVTLASDGRETSVVLSRQTLPVKQHMRVTPRTDKFATVMAEAARPAGVWPAGNMQLYRDGGYIGATHWNLQDAERTTLSFGRDDLMTVAMNTVEGKSGSKGFFGDRASRNSAEVFTLTSRHKAPVDVLVLESSPVSTSEAIKVQATFEPRPTIDAWEKRRGVVAWQRSLAPGESAKFQVEYRIDYPKEGGVSGLR